MANKGFVNQTTMARALDEARKQCAADGGNPGRIGHRILTNNAKMGICGMPATRRKQQQREDHTAAVSAV